MNRFNRGLALAILACGWPGIAAAGPDTGGQTELRQAFEQARRGSLEPLQAARFEQHPLSGWLQAVVLQQQLKQATPGQVTGALHQIGDQPAARWLREAWLGELARREAWPEFEILFAATDPALRNSMTLRCAELAARLARGSADAVWIADAKALWLTVGSVPEHCEQPFKALAERGVLDEALRWQRIELATAEANPTLMRLYASSLPESGARLANDYADFVEMPHNRTGIWPRDAESRLVATVGLTRYARRNPDGAETRLAELAPALGLDQAQRSQVLAQIALWTVASYGEQSARRFAAVPESAYDDRLFEWRVREAMTRSDDAAALVGIEKMPAPLRNDAHWQYFEARLRERLGQKEAARLLFLKAADSPSYHGWLAADRFRKAYALCALEPSDDPATRARLQAHPGLQRAFALFEIDEISLALREWTAALATMDEVERRVAIAIAQEHQWHDRGVFSIGGSSEDLRHYSLRFPLPYEKTLQQQAQINGLDPAWVAGQTRAESIFMATVTSAADARGLMQILPGTGAATARRIGREWGGAQSLYDPETNITLGSAYLRQMLDRYGGLPYVAIAAYNAGPDPVARWKQQRPALEPDFWIETIPYKETRDYVARVLAFSVIYDWRMNGRALPLSDRLLGHFDMTAGRRPFACPTPNTGP